MIEGNIANRLQAAVAIQLACIAPPVRRAFGGTGPSRRREMSVARRISIVLVNSLLRTFDFSRGGNEVSVSEIAAVIEGSLTGCPDYLARDWAGKDILKGEAAREAIAAASISALKGKFSVVPIEPPLIPAATGVWCGASDAGIDDKQA